MFPEDAALFMDGADASVSHSSGACVAWFDMPGQDTLGGRMLSNEYQITYASGALMLVGGDPITVNGVGYKVRQDSPLDDGVFRLALLSKV